MRAEPRTARHAERGLTLLEIMIAITVMSIGLFGLAQAMIAAARLDRQTNLRKIALDCAIAWMETIRSQAFGDLASAPPKGYRPAVLSTTLTGFSRDRDGDGDSDHFGQFYSARDDQPNYDARLLGLTAQSRTDVLKLLNLPLPAGVMPVAAVEFRDPDGSTGIGEGTGYWVTVRVFWQADGNSEVKLSSLVVGR